MNRAPVSRRPGSRPRLGRRDRSRLLSFVRSRAEEQVRFVEELCDRNSHTFNKEGADGVAAMVIDRLPGDFVHHRVLRQREVGDHHVIRNSLAGKGVYLVGHLDTVFPPDHPFQRCRRRGDVLLGPGAADMKGGLAVIVYALRALGHAGLLRTLDLTLILNGDEEIGSATSRPLFLRERRRALACLVAESAGPSGQIVTSRSGKMGARIICRGKDRHVGSLQQDKASAVVEMARLVVALESLNGMRPGVRVNVGKVAGGLGPGTVPAAAEAEADFRWTDAREGRALRRALKALAARPFQKGCRSELRALNSRPAMPWHSATAPLLDLVEGTARGLGQATGREHRAGTSDGNFFGAAGVPTLDGFGPVGFDDHTPREHILIPSLKERTALLAVVLAECGLRSGELFPPAGGQGARTAEAGRRTRTVSGGGTQP